MQNILIYFVIYLTILKSTQNYSINVKVLEAFNEEVDSGHRSEIIEALIINFLIENTREKIPSDEPSLTTDKETLT